MSNPVRHNDKRKIAIIALSVVIVLAIVAIILIMVLPKQNNSNNPEPVENINNIMDQEETDEIAAKGEEMIATEPENPSSAVDYYYNLVKSELDKNEITRAFQTIWVGYDNLSNSGNSKSAIEFLTKIDVAKFDDSQKYSIYQAIVDASEIAGDEATKAKYAPLAAEAKAASDAAFEALLKAAEQEAAEQEAPAE